jgi:hypothetical protein
MEPETAYAPREIEVLRIEVAKLGLAPGETLVVRVPPGRLERRDHWQQMQKCLRMCFPNNAVLLMTQDIELSVVQPEPVAEAAAS